MLGPVCFMNQYYENDISTNGLPLASINNTILGTIEEKTKQTRDSDWRL